MTENDDLELERGSGHLDAELEQLRSILFDRIIELLDAEKLLVRGPGPAHQ